MLHNALTLIGFMLVLTLNGATAQADTTIVAVAANFTKPMIEIASAFEQATGHSAKLAFGSSGKFITQIENGAPFEVFLSADEAGPRHLIQNGKAILDSCYTYAQGQLVLWSATPNLIDSQGRILQTGQFQHLAIADPKLAPYGAAAIDFLSRHQLLEKLQGLLVFGENITQTHQFISSGNAELGFVALSQVIDHGKITQGSGWIIPSDQYPAIKQAAVLLNLGADNPAARALMSFMRSTKAQAIIRQYGYQLP